VIARTSGRIFVGLPLCRDEDYINLNLEFAESVMKTAFFIKLFPKFLRPLVGPLITTVPSKIDRAEAHLKPLVEERRLMGKDTGSFESEDKPNDMLSWHMDAAPPDEQEPRDLALRLLGASFAGIHTTSQIFTHALYELAAHPEWLDVLRQEVDSVVEAEGWTKDGMQKMTRLDSFLRESQRLNVLNSAVMPRQAVKDFTFSDGTVIPKGTLIFVAAGAIQRDDDFYEDAKVFNPWRFSDKRAQVESEAEDVKLRLESTSTEYLTFALGKRACPGRFFAALEMKTVMAHIVAHYDVKLETPGQIPLSSWFTTVPVPNRTANVLFRKRQA